MMKSLNALGMIAAATLFLCSATLASLVTGEIAVVVSRYRRRPNWGPLTPGSVAGVNRRVHRRAYYGAVAAGAAGYGYYNTARRCAYWRAGVCARWY